MPGTVERLARAIRHSPALERAGPLWDAVRPAYDAVLLHVYQRRGLARTINGERFRIDPRCRNLREEHEPLVWSRLVGEARPGDRAVDVGGHLGVYSVALARRVRPRGRVVVFEPDDGNAILLKRNVELNGVAQVVHHKPAALGRKSGRARFTGGVSQISRVDEGGEREVLMSTLDAEFPDDRVDLLKIDVEGYELEVLAGGATLLTDPLRRPRLLAVEIHPPQLEHLGQSPDEVASLLNTYGYETRELVVDPLTQAWIATPRSTLPHRDGN
jgi:FkbM family methyltransferase